MSVRPWRSMLLVVASVVMAAGCGPSEPVAAPPGTDTSVPELDVDLGGPMEVAPPADTGTEG